MSLVDTDSNDSRIFCGGEEDDTIISPPPHLQPVSANSNGASQVLPPPAASAATGGTVVGTGDQLPLLADPTEGAQRRMGTVLGVLIPVMLSQFSSLLFLRVGYIVGQSGFVLSVFQLVLAYTILLCTILSLCALCTNGAISGGGAYYMISRTLGPEFGGSVGFLFFAANIFSSALYISGCVEGIVSNLGVTGEWSIGLSDEPWPIFVYAFGINCFNLAICLVGSSLYSRMILGIFLVVLLSFISVIISFFRSHIQIAVPFSNDLQHNTTLMFDGFNGTIFKQNLWPNYTADYTDSTHSVPTFFSVFAVLFSGVTGVMAGANMSGELKKPGKSIPRGTLPAQAITFLSYFTMFLLTACSSSPHLLHNDYTYLMDVNYWSGFVFIGIVMATVSASLSNLIGASRILEALVKDQMFGNLSTLLHRTTWKGNPLGAVCVCFLLVQLVLLVGSMNEIAVFASIFFLLSYSAVNLACLGLEWASAPNFRPSFVYFTWHSCVFGIVGSLSMSLLISWWCMLSSLVLTAFLVLLVHTFSPATENNWGSLSQALIFHQVRKYLLLLDPRKAHIKFWRPQILLMVANPRSACPLIEFVNDTKKSGLFVLAHVIVGDLQDRELDPCITESVYWLKLIDHLKVKAFAELTLAPSVRTGMQHLVRLCGIGGMKPNTVILGFRDDQNHVDFLRKSYLNTYNERTLSTFSPRYTSNRQLDVLRMCDLQCPLESAFHPEQLRVQQNTTCDSDGARISPREYVQIVRDLHKLRQNICLCRHFHNFDKKSILSRLKLGDSSGREYFIDAWPINLFDTRVTWNSQDVTSQFLLQISTVLLMTQAFRSTSMRLRVFLCVGSHLTAASVSTLYEALTISLDEMRVRAQIVCRIIPELEEDVKDIYSSSEDFVSRLNIHIREECSRTAVTYLYLPLPSSNTDLDLLYLRRLETLTEGLPPTVLVHGESAVTTTAL